MSKPTTNKLFKKIRNFRIQRWKLNWTELWYERSLTFRESTPTATWLEPKCFFVAAHVNREKRQWRRYRLSPVKTDKGNPVAGIFFDIPGSWLIVSTKVKDGDVAHHRADCRVYRRVRLRRRLAVVNVEGLTPFSLLHIHKLLLHIHRREIFTTFVRVMSFFIFTSWCLSSFILD